LLLLQLPHQISGGRGDVPVPQPLAVEQQIAAALVTTLNAHSFSRPFTAARRYQVKVDLESTKALTVSVVAQSKQRERSSRITNEHQYTVQVAVQQKINPADESQGDVLSYLVEEIADYLDNHWSMELNGCRVSLISDDANPLWLPDHMLTLRQFTNVTTYTFTVERERNPS
jgi:hypothetical protein